MTNLQLNDYTISILLGIITAIVIVLFYYIESLLYDKKYIQAKITVLTIVIMSFITIMLIK
jgi:uncharacterized protein (DUF983 family)